MVDRIANPKSLAQSDFSADDIRRFLSKIEIDQETGCWIWKGSVDRKGYARFWARGKNLRGNRVAVAMFGGSMSGAMHAHHTCFNPCCVNPAHITERTPEENSIDWKQRNEGQEVPF